MKSSMSFSKKTLFSQSVSSASISSVWRRIESGSPPHGRGSIVYQRQRVVRDGSSSAGSSHGSRGFLHAFQSLRIIEQCANFPGRYGKVVAADRGARFQQVVGIALFLAGNGFDQSHG